MNKEDEPKAKIRPKIDVELACDADKHTNWVNNEERGLSLRKVMRVDEAIISGTTRELDPHDSFLDIDQN
jgi:hypothetical protein